MGRNVSSMREEINRILERWKSYERAMKESDKIAMEKIIEKVKRHSGEAMYALDDPLEAVILSILVEMQKEIEAIKNGTN
ncbi:MAG: hypothetical protein ACP5F1_03845 [Thermoplasmata archaeon]|nr:hypothetical protein [Thermoplasmata archaeon]